MKQVYTQDKDSIVGVVTGIYTKDGDLYYRIYSPKFDDPIYVKIEDCEIDSENKFIKY